MMNSYVLGFFISVLVTMLPILFMATNKAIYVSLEGIVVVIGGTIAIALSSYPYKRVKLLITCIMQVTRKEVDDCKSIASEVIRVAQVTRGDRSLLQNQLDGIKHPFLKDGLQLIIDRQEEMLEQILQDRIDTKKRLDEKTVNMIKNLAKYPPALGLLATVISLVTLLEGMGGGNLGMGSLGPAMAVGLVGTLYGIVLANLMFSPIAENLAVKSSLDVQNRRIAMVGLIMISQKKSPLTVQEMVNSQLAPGDRVDVLGVEDREAA